VDASLAGNHDQFKCAALHQLAAGYGVSPEEMDRTGFALAGSHDEWYNRLCSALDKLPDDGWLYVTLFQLPRPPAGMCG
jgi:hypothetical protein